MAMGSDHFKHESWVTPLTRYDKLVINPLRFDINYNNSLSSLTVDFKSGQHFALPSTANCLFETGNVCLKCLDGFTLNPNSSCQRCVGLWNHIQLRCETDFESIATDLETDIVLQHSKIDEKNQISPDLMIDCRAIHDFSKDPVKEITEDCLIPMTSLVPGDFFIYQIEFTLNKNITDDTALELPSLYTFIDNISSNAPDYQVKSPFDRLDPTDQKMTFTLSAAYNGEQNLFYGIQMPDYKSLKLKDNELFRSIDIKLFRTKMDDLRNQNSDGHLLYINDLCPVGKFSQPVDLYLKQCLTTDPKLHHIESNKDVSLVFGCEKDCKLCNGSTCQICNHGFFLTKDGSNCAKCAPSCLDCKYQPENCHLRTWDALILSLQFFNFQASGYLQDEQRTVCTKYHSFLKDKGYLGEVLVGGWFHGLGTVKTNFSIATALISLLQGLLNFQSSFEKAQIFEYSLGIIKQPLYYLHQSYQGDDLVYVQCGDFQDDQAFWGRPEDSPLQHTCLSANQSRPATEIISRMATALALGYRVFKLSSNTDHHSFADNLLNTAKLLFVFASDNQKSYQLDFPDLAAKYPSSNFMDDYIESAITLYSVTLESTYLTIAQTEYAKFSANLTTYDFKDIENRLIYVNFMMMNHDNQQQFIDPLEDYINIWIEGQLTPGNLAYLNGKIDLNQVLNVCYWGIIYIRKREQNVITGNKINLANAKYSILTQLEYILGDNPSKTSLMVGYTQRYPKYVRHKASSCPPPPVPCDALFEFKSSINPVPIKGGIIQSLGLDDILDDSRLNPDNTVNIITNKFLPALLAFFFDDLNDSDLFEIDLNRIPKSTDCPEPPESHVGDNASNFSKFKDYLDTITFNTPFMSPFDEPLSWSFTKLHWIMKIRNYQKARCYTE